jgi:dTDP-3-amino-3,4,6-trideoxy-alpha-D-glucose transaminase
MSTRSISRGLPADVHGIADVAGRHGIPVLYDAAQAHGASVDGAPVGSYGDITAWSFYPGKNLGAFADGGAVTTDDAALVARVRRLRNYGSDTKYENIERGVNSRLDELQAAFLSVRLRSLNEWNERRRHIAEAYVAGLSDIGLRLPVEPAGSRSVWHVFAIRLNDRDSVQCELDAIGVQTFIHYPIPPHRQVAYADLDLRDLAVADRMAAELLSLPIGPHQTEEQTATVLAALRAALRAS